ncbi:uncharacterized protein PV09_01753 [Verruconis gallopava]|uniref:FAS1 domain-containing protein n=1 Tax=Verruconis gallopava TaxID=253628 RepID=A0A0D2AMT9_9PEZI|nr:uncharacterized protein PV09_01753 [Verruconis gallopava]KIW07835.1 hypothetical protein PV09_01753 [Verruconis gallopava]
MYHILRSSIPLLSLFSLSALASTPQKPLNMASAESQQPTLQSSSVTLSDVLPRSQAIGIFSSFCNDVPAVSSLLSSSSKNLTVLAPQDSAIKKLPRKPWEDPADYEKVGMDAYEGQAGVDRAQDNLRRFVEAHLVTSSPWPEGVKAKRISGEGGDIWWEMKEGKQVIQPGNIEVVQIADKVSNGEVWVVSGVLNYAR